MAMWRPGAAGWRHGALVALLLTGPAVAQDPYLDMFNTQNQAAVDMAGTAAVNSAIEQAARDADATVPGRTPGTSYAPDPDVSRRVEARFLRALAVRLPAESAAWQREFDNGDLRRRYRVVLDRLGLAEGDLADMTAAYYLGLWELVHGQSLDRARAAPAIEQMRRGVHADASLTSLDAARRQEVAEAYALYLAVALRTRDRIAGQPARMARLRQVIEAGRGIPLSRMQVDSRGFSSR